MKKAAFILASLLLAGLGYAAAMDTVPNRISFATPGEWVSYRLPNGYIQKFTVTKRFGEGPDAMVEITVDNIYDGEIINTKKITHKAGDPFIVPEPPNKPGTVVALRDETVHLNGKLIPVSVVEILRYGETPDDSGSTEWWSSAEIPVFGIIKKVEDGETQWELHKHGEAPAAQKEQDNAKPAAPKKAG